MNDELAYLVELRKATKKWNRQARIRKVTHLPRRIRLRWFHTHDWFTFIDGFESRRCRDRTCNRFECYWRGEWHDDRPQTWADLGYEDPL